MKTPIENLAAIEEGLRVGENESLTANLEWGGVRADITITDAQQALAELRQQVADLIELHEIVETQGVLLDFVAKQPRGTSGYYRDLFQRLASTQQTPADDSKETS